MIRADAVKSPSDTENRLIRIYNHYRIVVGLVLLASLFLVQDGNQDASRALYRYLVVAYFCIHLFTGLILLAGNRLTRTQITLSLILEMLVISGLLYTGGGLNTALSNLMLIAVAAATILLRGQLWAFWAAAASLAFMAVQTLRILHFDMPVNAILRAGLLGIAAFAIAFLIRTLAQRIQTSEALASQRARHILDLQKLNEQIIQRMRTGIIVARPDHSVRLANAAAKNLLGEDEQIPLLHLPDALAERLKQWQNNPYRRTSPFKGSPLHAPIQANFAALQSSDSDEILIFLDDTSKVAQQAQQLKLASLGRLTAGIAHEIRNPLGAISHAAQLMAESDTLSEPDRRMLDIIHRHCDRMNGLIENVLKLSRRGTTVPEEIELAPWLQRFCEDFTANGTLDADIRLQFHAERPMVYFDSGQLHQVLTNLVTNGMRYSREASGEALVFIEVGTLPPSGQVYIDVIDIGPGISEDQASHVFEPFYTTHKQGTGLGLYISRELCEANQAQLDYLPRTRGACFRITFAHTQRMIIQ
ncbi:MAG: PAS domain-containing sensor histidine kinase [Gammaproteobacteria bacterium]|nr:MAG: PAS domain-containing sensor histidine kinase [Gammaproteobacteria bacterium]